MNTGEPETAAAAAERRVLEIQTKLHRWASDDPDRRFDDLYNLVADPAFLLVAWARVRANKGARTAGVDGETARYIEHVRGVDGFLTELRGQLKARTFRPLPARQRAIPKANRKVRYLGIATIRDRVAQASLKLVWNRSLRRTVRHEALFHRGRWETSPAGRRSDRSEADGSPGLGVQASGGSSRDNVAEAWDCQTCRPRKQDGKG